MAEMPAGEAGAGGGRADADVSLFAQRLVVHLPLNATQSVNPFGLPRGDLFTGLETHPVRRGAALLAKLALRICGAGFFRAGWSCTEQRTAARQAWDYVFLWSVQAETMFLEVCYLK